MVEHYKKILADAERRVARSMELQVKSKGSADGGFLDDNGLVHGKFAIYRVTTAIAVYCNSDSILYRDKKTLELIRRGLSYIIRCQHENGLFDLISCNFNSAPDTAFCVKRFLPVLRYLSSYDRDQDEEYIYQIISKIVKNGAKGMMEGGFHTPNHRWAIASNLMECGRFFQEEEMVERAYTYLREGIDCNEDGEYTEKSSGNYNRINNDAMITLGDITGEDRYYQYAVKNLHMMLTYFEADGSIFTANSTRQDRGKTIYPRDYYLEYLDLGYRREIPIFLDTANYIFQLILEKQLKAPDCLIQLMNRPELIRVEHKGMLSSEEYSGFYRESGIFRGGRKGYTFTLMKGQSGFLHLSGESMRIQMKLCGSFFRHRSFCPEEIEQTEEGFTLSQQMEGWYYLPYEKPMPSSDWWEMNPEKREKLYGPSLEIEAAVKECEHGIEITVKTDGTTGAPFRIEFEITGAKWLWNDTMALPVEDGKEMILRNGMAVFSNDEESIEVGPGFGTHLYTEGRFGSETHSTQAFTLYLTDYTAFEHRIWIRLKKSGIRLEEEYEKQD